MIASSTHEEAPAEFGPWLKQRTRWMKGWMQTWAVHMRSPGKLLRELGPAGFAGVQLIVLGNVAAALVHPLFLAALIAGWATGYAPWHADDGTGLIVLYILNLLAGYIGSGLLGFIGLSRRGLRRTAWVLLLMPLHWLLLSLAAWRAVWQLVRAPQLWEKTEHGLARHSRRNEAMRDALLALERELSRLEGEGVLPEAAKT
jgi:cellulose synthase/poly-beta-1,6-N-acetylglucosamine synthase-like glycosyltransferase